MPTRITPTCRRFATRRLLVLALGTPLSFAGPAQAEVTATGSVSPNPLFLTAQDDLFVGTTNGGYGELTITDGSFVVSRNGSINGQGSRVTVTGPGSAWLMFGDLRVGNSLVSMLSILDGGTVTNQSVTMGASNPANFGTVQVEGAGSTWTNHGNLHLGGTNLTGFSDGYVSITNGGVVNVDGYTFSSPHPGNTSNLHFADGILNTHHGLVPLHAMSGVGTINADYWLLSGDYTLSSAADLPVVWTIDEHVSHDIDVNLAWSTPLDQLDFFGIDHGTMSLQNGLQVTSRDGFINYSGGAGAGVMTVDGPGTTWTVGREFYLADRGAGALNITGGGAVVFSGDETQSFHHFRVGYNTGGIGHIVVDGIGSVLDSSASGKQITLGDAGEGHLTIRNGATADLHGVDLREGTILIEGAGTSVASTSFNVHAYGNIMPQGTTHFTLMGGAALQSDTGHLSGSSDVIAYGVVDGPGTVWSVNDTLRIGSSNVGVLDVTGGAELRTGGVTIGWNTHGGGQSRLNIAGAGTRWTNLGDATLGDEGFALVSVSDGATATITGTLAFDVDLGSSGYESYIELDHGTLNLGGGFITASDIRGTGTVNTDTWLLEGTHTLTGFADLPTTMQVSHLPDQNLTVNAAWDVGATVHFSDFGVDGGDVTLAGGFNLRTANGYVGYTEGASGSLVLTGVGTRWRMSSIRIGEYGEGVVRVEDGAVLELNGSLVLGDEAGSSGHLVVTGMDSAVAVTPNQHLSVVIGQSGTGSARVEQGATVVSDTVQLGVREGGRGELTLTGAGTTWTSGQSLNLLGPGPMGSAVVHITDGAQAFFTYASLGHDTSPSGVLNIDGVGSALTLTHSLSAGDSGSARLNITDGGTLSSVGQTRFHGDILIDAVGSGWTLDGAFYLGERIESDLTLTGGATLTTGDAFLGYNRSALALPAQSSVLIDGAGTAWTIDGALQVGGGGAFDGQFAGLADLTIANEAAVTVAGSLTVDRNNAGSSIHLDNGTLNTGSALVFNNQLTGTGTINADYWLINGDHTINSFASLPSQMTLDALPGQDITVNLAWSDPAQTFDFFGVDEGTVLIGAALPIHSTDGYVAYNDGSVGSLTFQGAGASWLVDEDLFVGHGGAGTLRIESGAQLQTFHTYVGEATVDPGRLEVSGAGSSAQAERMIIGSRGVGMLAIDDGAEVLVQSTTGASNGQLMVGDQAGSQGVVDVSGVGTRLEVLSARPTIGNRGAGSLSVRDGAALLTTSDTYVGRYYNGAGQITIDNATWDTESLFLGHDGTAHVAFLNGATVTSRSVRLGSENETYVDGVEYVSRGEVLVDGPGTLWNVEFDIQVGLRGDGVLDITHGARVGSRGGVIGFSSERMGAVTVSGAGSAWNMSGSLVQRPQPIGTLVVEDGGLVQSETMELSGVTTVRGAGARLVADIAMDIQFLGVLRVEDGGRVETQGDLTFHSGSRLHYVLDHANSASVVVDGGLSLIAAGLTLETTQDLTYGLGDTFTLIEVAKTSSGTFNDALESTTLDSRNGFDLLLTYTGGDGNDVGLTTAVSGDINGDDLADGADVAVILNGWQQQVTVGLRSEGDLHISGILNGSDLSLMAQAQLDTGEQLDVVDIEGTDPAAYNFITEGQTLFTHDGVDVLLTYFAGDGNDVALIGALAGDIDGDGFVGAADLDILLANWGQVVTPNARADGDLTGDGFVDRLDLQRVVAYWGGGSTPGPNIPEPGTCLLLAAGLIGLSKRRR
ncbi:PEP-CTERM sorting domain-containing protein [Phycisphaeraceae bacterium D3-23]